MWAHQKQQSGFTIVELLIVIVVIGILAAITIVAFNGVQDRTKVTKSQSDLKSIQKLLELYYVDNGAYPHTIVSGTRTWFFQSTSGNNFIPGLVPTYAPTLPTPTAGTYIYQSSGVDYKLMRYATINTSEWAQVPAAMIDGTGATNKDRYGYWTAGAAGY
jgi:general secretion pathway protein G